MAEKSFDTWEDIKDAYYDARRMSCKPDQTKFRRPRPDEVIDEEMSVRWNREEVARMRYAYDEEVKRLNRAKNEAKKLAESRAIVMIAFEAGVSKAKAELIWQYAYSKHCDENLFEELDELIELARKIVAKD